MCPEVLRRVISARASSAAAQARALGEIVPSLASRAERVGGGWLVLSGQGMYVNRAMGAHKLSADELERIIAGAEALGVDPAVELTSFTGPSTRVRLAERGFAGDAARDVSLLTRDVSDLPPGTVDDVAVRPVMSEYDLAQWKGATAAGWGHVSAGARSVSDAFTSAARVTDGEGMVLACDAVSGAVIGCASVTVSHGVAMLGACRPGRNIDDGVCRHRCCTTGCNGPKRKGVTLLPVRLPLPVHRSGTSDAVASSQRW